MLRPEPTHWQDDDPGSGPPQEPRTAASAAIPLDLRGLRSLHLDLLGRPPFRAEVEERRGSSLQEVATRIVGTLEFWRAWLDEQLFFFLLIDNFTPHSERILEVPEALSERRLDVREAIHRICLSPSFELRNPGADTFVTVVMEQLLGIEVQKSARELELGKGAYDGRSVRFLGKAASSQADVVRIAMEDSGFAVHFLRREYERLVHSTADTKELARQARAFSQEPGIFPSLVRNWLESDAYRERLTKRFPQPNRMFVNALFVDVLDRRPTADETEALREALDGLADAAPLRSVVARTLIDGPLTELPAKEEIAEPAAWIASCFERLLGRLPEPSESTAFAEAWKSSDCRPQTVLYALASSHEYATY